MSRLPVLIRRNEVFELVLAGKTHAEIAKKLKVSDDTIARDLKAIADDVQALVSERSGEILAAAIANIGKVIVEAWSEYELDKKRERDWFAGKLDYETIETTETIGEDAVEISTKTSMARPTWRSRREKWMQIILKATSDLVELTGLKEIVVRHKGSIQMTEEGEKEAHERLSTWRAAMLEQLRSSSALVPPTQGTSRTNTGS